MMLNVLVFLVILIRLPLMALLFVFKHRIVLIGVLVIALTIGGYHALHKTTSSSPINSNVAIPYFEKIEPPKSQAPQVIQTVMPDRVYYVSSFDENSNFIILRKYFYFENNKWQPGYKPLPLDKGRYGKIVLYNR